MHLCVSYIFSIFYSDVASEVKSKAQRGLFKDNTPVSATPVISDPVDNPLDDEGYDGFVISPSSAFASMSSFRSTKVRLHFVQLVFTSFLNFERGPHIVHWHMCSVQSLGPSWHSLLRCIDGGRSTVTDQVTRNKNASFPTHNLIE